MTLLLKEKLLAIGGGMGAWALILAAAVNRPPSPISLTWSVPSPTLPKPVTPASPQPKARKSEDSALVDLSERTVKVIEDGQAIATYPVDIGGSGTPTPTGSFTVLQMKEFPTWQNPRTGEKIPPGAGNPIGSRWIGFVDIPRGSVGFHEAVDGGAGRAASQGCIRLRRGDLEALYAHVREGMPVIVQE